MNICHLYFIFTCIYNLTQKVLKVNVHVSDKSKEKQNITHRQNSSKFQWKIIERKEYHYPLLHTYT